MYLLVLRVSQGDSRVFCVLRYAEKSAAVAGVAEAGARVEEADAELSAMTAAVAKVMTKDTNEY